MRPDAAQTLGKGLVGHRPVELQLQQGLRPSKLNGHQLSHGPIVSRHFRRWGDDL